MNRSAELKRNLLYVIIAEATNMGLSAMAESCGVPYDVLAWTAEWYFRSETLEAASAATSNSSARSAMLCSPAVCSLTRCACRGADSFGARPLSLPLARAMAMPSRQAAEHHKRAARMFLTWAITTHRMPNLALPTLHTRTGERLTQTRRLALLRRVLTDDGPPTPARAAAALILLYAQPATRIVRLTVDDILDLGDQMMIRLGEPPSPVPDPLTDILRHLVAGMPGATSTTRPAGRWLFPGTRPGQPTHPRHLLDLVRGLGIPAQATRVAALRHLVLHAPAPVIADALGYHTKHVAKVWTEAGGTWKTYAPGDHSK